MNARIGLSLQDVTIAVAGIEVVHEVSLGISPGSVVGLVGPNGCGKSTLLKALYRALQPCHGAILVNGTDLAGLPFKKSASLIAALPQEERGELDFTVAEVVSLGSLANPTATREGGNQAVESAMARTGVAEFAHRSFLDLSGGERQRTLLARALAQETPYLLLDEPTNHLDLRHQVDLVRDLRSHAHSTESADAPDDDASSPSDETRRPSVVMALHDLNLAASSCDRIIVMDRGRIVADGPPAETLDPDLVEKVYKVRPMVTARPDTGAPYFLFPM
ncbi:ABC transporter ATP-binding protein [Rothia uropygioeca]|uniref:ABC transporter ATP-binding protein n=1 Tax=Kocuria sp. 257 TaxID=2021970 RepID=UPI0010108765|nr:ABC transporter ATP-binding protein [Kocuria sp. 257]